MRKRVVGIILGGVLAVVPIVASAPAYAAGDSSPAQTATLSNKVTPLLSFRLWTTTHTEFSCNIEGAAVVAEEPDAEGYTCIHNNGVWELWVLFDD